MQISQEGIALIKKFEGCKLESYKCAAGVWTIGYGSTDGITKGMSISQERADMLLLEDIQKFEQAVNDLVEVSLNQNEFDALVSWTFNLGPTNLKNSTLLKVLNSTHKDWNDIPKQIKRWNKANGKVLEGLVRRREAEALLFTGQDWTEV
jgi:lysozyme